MLGVPAIEGQAGQRVFEGLLLRLSERGYLKKRGVQRTDSTHVLAAVRRLNRLELLGETLRAALNAVAREEPEWLKAWVLVAWFERYSRRIEEWRLPEGKQRQEQWMQQIGEDGSRLLTETWAEQAPEHLRQLTQVERLRQIWVQQFLWQEGHLQVRNKDDLPPAHRTIRSPYDQEAHYGHKRDLSWFGYKVHFSESCHEEAPHLITAVLTTDATQTDMEQTQHIHEELAAHDVLPEYHLVDAGYIDAALIIESQGRYGIELVGPVSRNNQWQAQCGGYDLAQFRIDWSAKEVVCPQGKTSVKWTPGTDQYGHPNLAVRFGLQDCRACPARSLCTRSPRSPRTLTMRCQAEFEQLHLARIRQQETLFQTVYAKRSGIEGTHSQAVRSLGLRRTRYIGLAKTSLQHLFTAAAINLIRLDAFLEGRKTAKSRTSHFAALAPTELVG